MGRKHYTVDVWLDEDGPWVGIVRGLRGVHTQARTLDSLRERIAEAIEAAREPAGEIELKPHLPAALYYRIGVARGARRKAEQVNAEAQRALRAAVRELRRFGISVRDAGALLGISFQRVQQLDE